MLSEFPALIHDLDEGLAWIALPAKQASSALSSGAGAARQPARRPHATGAHLAPDHPRRPPSQKPEGSQGLLTSSTNGTWLAATCYRPNGPGCGWATTWRWGCPTAR